MEALGLSECVYSLQTSLSCIFVKVPFRGRRFIVVEGSKLVSDLISPKTSTSVYVNTV